MTAFTGTPSSSLQYADQLTSQMGDPVIAHGDLRVANFKYTHVLGAGTGEINLVKLPPGLIRVFSDLCRLVTADQVSGATMDIGYRAHVNMDGTAVVEDDNALADDLASGAGALDQTLPLPAVGFLDLDSEDGVVIFATVDTANIEDTDTIDGYIVYAQAA